MKHTCYIVVQARSVVALVFLAGKFVRAAFASGTRPCTARTYRDDDNFVISSVICRLFFTVALPTICAGRVRGGPSRIASARSRDLRTNKEKQEIVNRREPTREPPRIGLLDSTPRSSHLPPPRMPRAHLEPFP